MKKRIRQHVDREFHNVLNGQTNVESLVELAAELRGPFRHLLLNELIKNTPRHKGILDMPVVDATARKAGR
jgi:hypothetical protein